MGNPAVFTSFQIEKKRFQYLAFKSRFGNTVMMIKIVISITVKENEGSEKRFHPLTLCNDMSP